MKKVGNDNQAIDSSNAEYVVLRTSSMNSNSKSTVSKIDNLSLLLQESDSVTNFRFYLDSINNGHFLDFWFACQGFKNFDRTDTHKLHQLTKVIYRAYIRSESPYAVPLKQNTKKSIVDKLADRKCFDPSIFDTAQMEIREILSGEFLINFLQSDFYSEPKPSDKNSLTTNNINAGPRITDAIGDIPVSSSSSSGNVVRKLSGARFNMVASRSSEAVVDGNTNKIPTDNAMGQAAYSSQNTGTITTVFNNNHVANNGSGTGSKDRRNLSEIDPPAFAKLLYTKLEEVLLDQAKFEKMLRLVRSVPTESDTDDSSSSAISYLMRCQWAHSRGANSNRQFESELADAATVALAIKTSNKLKTVCRPGDIRDDHAQDILENHCSRIGLDEPVSRHVKRDLSEGGKTRWRREHDLGSITSYDSGVATSLEQYSSFGMPGSIMDNMSWQKSNFKPINLNETESSPNSHRYHHHHHHHHHKSHFAIAKNQNQMESSDNAGLTYYKDVPSKKQNISEVSSNFDSGVSSAYEYMGRRLQPMNDKVTNWMCKNSNITSNGPYNVHDFDSNTTSGIPPNTPLISVRGYTSPSFCDIYPNQIYMLPKSVKQSNLYSPVPECESIPHQSLENWLEQQATVSASALIGKSGKSHTNFQKPCYCSSTVGLTGSELLTSDDSFDNRDTPAEEVKNKDPTKDPSVPKANATKSNSLVVGYYIGNDPVPYRTQIPDAQYITLGQFKLLVAKKGPFRYFFKRYCDEFDCGVVHEEITKDDAILPLWEGKVVAKIEKAE